MIGNQAQGRCILFSVLLIFLFDLNGIYTQDEISAVIGSNVSLVCNSSAEKMWWSKNGQNITKNQNRFLLTQHPIDHLQQNGNNIIDDNENGNMAIQYPQYKFINYLNITSVEKDDVGLYICHFLNDTYLQQHEGQPHNEIKQQYQLLPIIPPIIVSHSPQKIEIKISHSLEIFCLIKMYPIEKFNSSIKWYKIDDNISHINKSNPLISRTKLNYINSTHCNVTLDVIDVSKKDNGTYVCSISSVLQDEHYKNKHHKSEIDISVVVLDIPQVNIDYVKAVGAHKIFLNWTIIDGNKEILKYFISYLKDGDTKYNYYSHNIDGKNRSYILDNFDANSNYKIKISAINEIGSSIDNPPSIVKTLEFDPIFIPEIEVKGTTHSAITIGWQPPSQELLEYIQYYELIVSEVNEENNISSSTQSPIEETMYPQNNRNLPYMFDYLKPSTEYKFQVRACNELTQLCGNWSKEVTGITMDGISSEPINLKVQCTYYNISGLTKITANWAPPIQRNGKIISYHVLLKGLATFHSADGALHNETYGPKSKSIPEKFQKAEYDNIPLNTNYTIQVTAVTRSKKPGVNAIGTCQMPPSVPDNIGPMLWGKFETNVGNWIFKLILPRISERNGSICGYRIYLVRLGNNGNIYTGNDNNNNNNNNNNNKYLKPPENLNIMSYEEVHDENNKNGGTYIAEILPNKYLPAEIYLGDGAQQINTKENLIKETNESCRKLLSGYYKKSSTSKTAKPTSKPVINELFDSSPISTQKDRLDKAGNLTSEASKIMNSKNRRRRYSRNTKQLPSETTNDIKSMNDILINDNISINDNKKNNSMNDDVSSFSKYEIFDGELDPNSNYTGFVEVIVNIDEENKTESAFSEYFDTMTAGPSLNAESKNSTSYILNIVVHVLCVLILLVLILLMALCFLHRYYSKNSAQGEEVISLRDSLSRALCGGRINNNHRHLIGGLSTSKPTDVGPIMKLDLPQAYVQRHKDTDYGFLREYEMLPNRFTDRTTKNSDAKENALKNRYPDIKAYDQTRVRLAEKNGTIGSDYINANFVLGYKERKKFICAQGPMDSTVNDFWRMIWEQHLEIIVMLTNLEEYNKAKCAKYWPEKINDLIKFGDISVTFLEEKRFSDYSIRDLKVTRKSSFNNDEDEELRNITQYHYSVWKDFMAPEHPHGIIKFIRRINSVYSLQRGPILVHCSAGVGRTGTLVALDSLMQQLDDENQVSIYNTVCDMRHQRNFLVQSLKQYIFLYRALLDIAQFGNTEISAKDLATTVENLKLRQSDSKEQCKLELEFEKLKSINDDTNKSCSVASGDENRCKNRNENVIPFDKNRVILTPIPNREHSTYINASFIEGYDNSESFIITQDPLENTIGDFWRMILEQGINTIVMMSEIGDCPKKCPRYWGDDEIQYDHILLKYIQSESCPYYTKREFDVINCKVKDTIKVKQIQYNGWPTVEGEVPEVSRGMIELIDQALNYNDNNQDDFLSSHFDGPIAVHCNLGTDRSSIFIVMCILVQQLRIEKKIDVCSTVRKLRSQRNLLIDSYAQYEFLHRAIVNYADLHRLSIDSPFDSQ